MPDNSKKTADQGDQNDAMVIQTCGHSSIEWPVPTIDMEYIEVTCSICGDTWLEPNELYIKEKLNEIADKYYSKFG